MNTAGGGTGNLVVRQDEKKAVIDYLLNTIAQRYDEGEIEKAVAVVNLLKNCLEKELADWDEELLRIFQGQAENPAVEAKVNVEI